MFCFDQLYDYGMLPVLSFNFPRLHLQGLQMLFVFIIDEFPFSFFHFPLTLDLKSKCINSCICIELALWFWQISKIDQIIAIKDSLQLRVLDLWATSSFCYVIPMSIAM